VPQGKFQQTGKHKNVFTIPEIKLSSRFSCPQQCHYADCPILAS